MNIKYNEHLMIFLWYNKKQQQGYSRVAEKTPPACKGDESVKNTLGHSGIGACGVEGLPSTLKQEKECLVN